MQRQRFLLCRRIWHWGGWHGRASEAFMRHNGNFNPEWGYLAPAPNFLRTTRLFVVAAAIGATASAAVVFSLMDRPAAETSVAARTLMQPVEPARNAPQLQTPSTHASVSQTQRADASGAIWSQGAAVVAHASAGSPAASKSGAASTTQHPTIAAALAESPRTMTTEAPPVRPLASESNTVPAAEAAPAAALKAPVRKPHAVARAAPRYRLPRYAAPGYNSMERGPFAFLRQYGSYGGQEY